MIRHPLLWPPVAAAILVLAAGPALAAHTQDAVVYDPHTGEVVMVILPADDAVLADPAFNPPGLVQQRVVHQDGGDPVATAQAAAPRANIQLPSAALDAQISASILQGANVTPDQPATTGPTP